MGLLVSDIWNTNNLSSDEQVGRSRLATPQLEHSTMRNVAHTHTCFMVRRERYSALTLMV